MELHLGEGGVLKTTCSCTWKWGVLKTWNCSSKKKHLKTSNCTIVGGGYRFLKQYGVALGKWVKKKKKIGLKIKHVGF